MYGRVGQKQPGGRGPAESGGDDHRRQHLTGYRGVGRPGHPQLRDGPQPEDQKGVQHNVGEGAGDLGRHGQAHVAPGLVHLAPVALQKYADAAHADDHAVGDGVLRHAEQGEHRPAEQGQHGAHSGDAVRRMVLSPPVQVGHQGVDAHAGPHRDGGNDELHRVDDGQGGQTVVGVLAHKVAVHDVVHGLDQLGQHNRGRDPQQDGPNALCIKKTVGRTGFHGKAVLLGQ